MKKIIKDISYLRQKSEPVTSPKEALEIIKELEEALGACNNGLGLSAIQIGIPKRVCVIKDEKKETFRHFINSEITEQTFDFVFSGEGCLSFPEVYVNTSRYRQISLDNYRIEDDGLILEKLVCYYNPEEGYPDKTSIVVQHELDHFQGILMFDREAKSIGQIKAVKKISRNSPCPCGKLNPNGNPVKYKNCCLNNCV